MWFIIIHICKVIISPVIYTTCFFLKCVISQHTHTRSLKYFRDMLMNYVIGTYTNVVFGVRHLSYILKSNPHTFYSFRGLKNQMRIKIACELNSRSRAGF